jgi:hypothetical protein
MMHVSIRRARSMLVSLLVGTLPASACTAAPASAPSTRPAWAIAAESKPPMTADEARAFISRLHAYVRDHHLKTAENSPQRGMIYEYFNVPHAGKVDQWIEGEALDTMHDGAWYAAAMVNAYRATGDETYRKFLAEYQVPFYCKILNHSDTLFSARQNDADPKANVFNREHMLQEGEKGFVPYWWDDGASVSLERVRTRSPLGAFLCRDLLAGKTNPDFRLSGYSLGSSNHLAQDLGIMIEQSWLLFRQLPDAESKKLTAELADAATNLHECRMRHHGHIPMCDASAALIHGDAKLMQQVPDPAADASWKYKNAYYQAFYDFKPGVKVSFPGFADDDEYFYYFGTARAGGKLPDALALKLIYDAYTQPLLYRAYCDDEPVPGINRFDLHPYYAVDGKPTDYRSDRKGPSRLPRPIGSRMGPQNMVVCGWALQALGAHPGLWNAAVKKHFKGDAVVRIGDMPAPLHGEYPVPDFVENKLFPPFPHLWMFIMSTRSALALYGSCDAAEARIEIFSQPDGKGAHAILLLKQDNSVSITNDKGEPLEVDRTPVFGNSATKPAGQNGFNFNIAIPYTFMKGQKPWINGVEMGRYSIRAGDAKPQNFFMASDETQVLSTLWHELAGGLRSWEAIFDQYGYIPTGIGAGAGWDNFSDTGGYAHLISAAAQWILCLEKKSDWEMQEVPEVLVK